MFSRLGELREAPIEAAASRLRGLLNPSDSGAEHQSLQLYCAQADLIEKNRLHLFCSDTEDGLKVARILKARFKEEFGAIEIVRCKDLRDDDARVFANRGLRSLVNNLVRTISDMKARGLSPAIDATGGYKPQIAYAALVGQVMQVPVYYRYQDFPRVIQLQPLPVSVDTQVWFDHLWFFEPLREGMLHDRDIPQWDPRIGPLIEREDKLVVLSPLGELVAGVVDQLLSARGKDLLPPDSGMPPERKKIAYEDGNSGKHRGLAEFCTRLCAVRFVTRVATYYYNPDLPEKTAVRLPAGCQEGPDRLDVWYGDGTALTKLHVWTTATTPRELTAARAALSQTLETDQQRI